MATSQFALADGGNVIALDINQERLNCLNTEIGVQHTVCVDPSWTPDQICEKITAVTGGDLPTCVFEVTGFIGSMKNSFSIVAHVGAPRCSLPAV